jgi:hypothetical protein
MSLNLKKNHFHLLCFENGMKKLKLILTENFDSHFEQNSKEKKSSVVFS